MKRVQIIDGQTVRFDVSRDGKTINRLLDKYFNGVFLLDEGFEVISQRAFAGRSEMAGVSMPQSLRIIGAEAFRGCAGLRRVVIPEGIDVIPRECFSGCTSLVEVQLPSSVKQIANGAFCDCPLEKINLEVVARSLDSIGQKAFRGHKFETPNLPESVMVNGRAFK